MTHIVIALVLFAAAFYIGSSALDKPASVPNYLIVWSVLSISALMAAAVLEFLMAVGIQ